MQYEDDELPADLITIKEAARLVNNTHRGTIRRWILKGKLAAWKLAGKTFLVSRADVLRMIQPHRNEEPQLPPTKREKTRREKYVQKRLKELGFRR